MDINTLVKVTSRAWSLNILALLHSGVPGRQAPLLAATGAGRTAFAASLGHLVDLGLLERNPGHGHPLRPEYRLTQHGIEMAALAARISEIVPDETDFTLLRRMWTLPVLAVTQRPRHFSQIKSDLVPITDRALSQSLRDLHARDWLCRDVDVSQHPPRPVYQAVNAGARLSTVVNAV